MFKKLHIRLTLYMVLILMAFMSILAIGIYHFTSSIFEQSAKQAMKFAAARHDILNNMQSPFFDLRENKKFFFANNSKMKINYIYYDKFFNLAYVKSEDSEIAKGIMEYAIEAFDKKTEIYDNKEIDGINYRVYTKYVNENGVVGVIQIYADTIYEKMFLAFLRSVLLIIGTIGMIIMVIISYFFTGKVIQPVKQSWIKQKKFVADASHELRTPLTVIQTNLDAALSDEEGTIKENNIWLNNAYSETKVMAKLIQQLLILAKIDANKIKLDIQDINLSDIIFFTIENFKIMAKNKNIEIQTDIQDDVHIKGDYDKIRQLIVILLDNAIKYTEEGSIKVSLKVEKHKKVLIIKDTGIGIKQEDIKKLFDRFYRADKARNRQAGGTGLGLSIAKWIVDVHKGTIEIESTLGKGSMFIVTFN